MISNQRPKKSEISDTERKDYKIGWPVCSYRRITVRQGLGKFVWTGDFGCLTWGRGWRSSASSHWWRRQVPSCIWTLQITSWSSQSISNHKNGSSAIAKLSQTLTNYNQPLHSTIVIYHLKKKAAPGIRVGMNSQVKFEYFISRRVEASYLVEVRP